MLCFYNIKYSYFKVYWRENKNQKHFNLGYNGSSKASLPPLHTTQKQKSIKVQEN